MEYRQFGEEYQANQFQSNIDRIPKNVKTKINDDFIKKMIKEIHLHTNKYNPTPLNTKRFKIIFEEMIGSIYYNVYNNKKIKERHTEVHLIGMQYPEAFCNLMKNKYPELKKANTWKIMNAILKYSGFFTQYYINEQGWLYYAGANKEKNYCRQFDLFNNDKHILLTEFNSTNNLIINSLKYYLNTTINYINTIINNDLYNKIIFKDSINFNNLKKIKLLYYTVYFNTIEKNKSLLSYEFVHNST
jgi:hypothetical protein